MTAALESLGPPRAADLPLLAALAAHENADVGFWAVTLIGRAGAAAAGQTSCLIKALQKNADQVRRIRRILEDLSLQIATPDEARAILQLKGGRDVAF